MIMIENEEQYFAVSKLREDCSELCGRLRLGESVKDLTGCELTHQPADVIRSLTRWVDQYDRSLAAYDTGVHGDRKGNWFPLFTKKRFWPEDPRPEDIDIRDIARGLSRLNRFNGQTWDTYPVAQHCVLASRLLPTMFTLMHDAEETYLGDIVTPIKRLLKQFYDPVAEQVMQAVSVKYGFTMHPDERELVKKADLVMLATEVRDLTPCQVLNRKVNLRMELPHKEKIGRCWSPEEAEERFLERFEELHGQAA